MKMLSLSPGCSTTVWVCEPRQVCTLVTSLGFLTSLMSKMRMPRTRSLLIGSGTPPKPQSTRLVPDSDDMNSRFLKTETSFCDAGQLYWFASTGFSAFETSQMSKPLYCPWIVYLPLNARSECVAPSDLPLGGVVDTRFMFQAAWPASHQPALRPTRGSGDGAVADTIGVTGFGIVFGGSGGGGCGAPRPPRPPAAGAPAAGASAGGCPAAGAAAGGGAAAAAGGVAGGAACGGVACGGVACGGAVGAAAGGGAPFEALPHAAMPSPHASVTATVNPANNPLIT